MSEQLTEAKKLKANIDKRSMAVAQILGKYLKPDEFADYEHFMQMKAKLIMDTREVQDKIALADEQMNALRESM